MGDQTRIVGVSGIVYYFGSARASDEEVSVTLEEKLMHETVRGIYVLPPDTTPLEFIFNASGQLRTYMDARCYPGSVPVPGEKYYLENDPQMKTTGAVASHVLICCLLENLKKQYMSDLDVDDSTDFYQTRDYAAMERDHTLLASFLGMINRPEGFKTFMKASGRDLDDALVEPVKLKTPLPGTEPKTERPKRARKQAAN